MEITGKIILALPEQSGVSRSGNQWKKREYVLETQEQYPRKVFFNFFGDRADQYPLVPGDTVTVSFDIESREFNGRWYTDIRAWKAEKGDAAQQPAAAPAQNYQQAPAAQPAPAAQAAPAVDPFAATAGDSSEDLPF